MPIEIQAKNPTIQMGIQGPRGEQEHLYAKTLFIGSNDTIDNYIEVDEVI